MFAARIAYSAATFPGGTKPFDDKAKSDFIQTFADEITVLAFFDAGLAWIMFTRREQRLEKIEKERTFFDTSSATAFGYYKAVETTLLTPTFDETLVNAAKTEMAELGSAVAKFTKQKRIVWLEFYQQGVDLIGGARALDREKRLELWLSEIKEFSDNLARIQKLEEY